jgi:predicted phosphoadenosine phosphosulfate sulfurtransferase
MLTASDASAWVHHLTEVAQQPHSNSVILFSFMSWDEFFRRSFHSWFAQQEMLNAFLLHTNSSG